MSGPRETLLVFNEGKLYRPKPQPRLKYLRKRPVTLPHVDKVKQAQSALSAALTHLTAEDKLIWFQSPHREFPYGILHCQVPKLT